MSSKMEIINATADLVRHKLAAVQRVRPPARLSRTHLIRRLDWRFLLPDPCLRQVGFMGIYSSELSTALSINAESLQILTDHEMIATFNAISSFDLIVLRSPAIADAAKAFYYLKNGGHLYWEIYQPGWIERLGQKLLLKETSNVARKNWRELCGLTSSGYYKRVLARKGFSEIETFWNRPDFNTCKEIIPINTVALDYLFSKRVPRFLRLGGCYKLLIRCIIPLGLLPSISIIATKESKEKMQ
jgi:hypothetical protein